VIRHALTAGAIGVLCWPMTCGAQMVAPTPQPPGIPVTPEEAAEVEIQNWAVHGQSTFTWMLQPAFHALYRTAKPAARRQWARDVRRNALRRL